jgi:hypothetical protein
LFESTLGVARDHERQSHPGSHRGRALAAVGFSHKAELPTAAAAATQASLTREQVENIVWRSYQYVAMFNVIQKGALDPVSGGMFTDGFNKPKP